MLDGDEELLGELRVVAGRDQRDQLLAFAAAFVPRTWAIEAATGWGALLAQQLVAVGEAVLDVPPGLSARARLLDAGNNSKTDPHDARSAAVVALRHRRLHVVEPVDHRAVLRLLTNRQRDLVSLRTQAICRLHSLLCLLIAGGQPRGLSATAAATALRKVRATDPVDVERKAMATDLLTDVRRLDNQIKALKTRIAAVTIADTTVTDVYGAGPVVAAILIGHTGDISRFPTAGHDARYNATAPIEASSGPRTRHRLNPRGNRQLNHALHMAAVTQIRNDTPGRAYYLGKQAEGKSRKEASAPSNDASATPSTASSSPTPAALDGPGRTPRDDTSVQRDRPLTLTAGSSDKSLPNPPTTLRPQRPGRFNATNRAARRVADLALRAAGGSGYLKSSPIERHFRDAQAAGLMAYSTEVCRDVVGKTILGVGTTSDNELPTTPRRKA